MHEHMSDWHWMLGFSHWGWALLFWLVTSIAVVLLIKNIFSKNEEKTEQNKF